jgi:hypothetical protein
MISRGDGDAAAIGVVAGGVALYVGVVFGTAHFHPRADAFRREIANRQRDVLVLKWLGAGAMLPPASLCPFLFRAQLK